MTKRYGVQTIWICSMQYQKPKCKKGRPLKFRIVQDAVTKRAACKSTAPLGLRTSSPRRRPELVARCTPVILERMACVVLPPRRQQCLGRPSRSRDRGAVADVDKRACIGQTASHFRLHTRWTRLPCHHCPGGIDNLVQVVSADQGEWNLDPLTWGPSPSRSHTLFAHTPQDKGT